MQSLGIHFAEVNNIYVGLVNTLEVAYAGVQPQWCGPVNASDSHTVAWLNTVNKVVVSINKNSVRCLTRWHVICQWEKSTTCQADYI